MYRRRLLKRSIGRGVSDSGDEVSFASSYAAQLQRLIALGLVLRSYANDWVQHI